MGRVIWRDGVGGWVHGEGDIHVEGWCRRVGTWGGCIEGGCRRVGTWGGEHTSV